MEADDELVTILGGYRHGHLATTGADGVPHLVPICFVYEAPMIYSAIDHKPKRSTGYRMKRVRNMLENPNVAFLVDHYEEDWQQLSYVMIRGTASILESGGERQRALELLEAKYSQYEERGLAGSTGLVIKIAPDRINRWQWK